MKKKRYTYDAVVIGSGPNGLAAAIRLALEGLRVKVFEAAATVGGGARSAELLQNGVVHDICSAIHPMAVSSPFFKLLPLQEYGLNWIHPDNPVAHPMDDRPAVIQHRSISEMDIELSDDFNAWSSLYGPYIDNWDNLVSDLLGPLRIPSNPFKTFKFGMDALQSASSLVERRFTDPGAKALFGGIAAHSILNLDTPFSSAAGLLLGTAAHTVGWPLPRGGSQQLSNALAHYFLSIGGVIETDCEITDYRELPSSQVILYDLSPRQILNITGELLPQSYRRRLKRFRHGPGVCKVDYILSEPVPWSDPRCFGAGTVHIGGRFEEIALSEKQVQDGVHPEKPFVLVAQQSLFDNSRTPDHRHTLWAYCHVPNGSDHDMSSVINRQIERFAPGFRDVIIEYETRCATNFESYNSNYIGGDITGGVQDIRQLFTRPASLFNPYYLKSRGHYICSASSPPGGGVHGMCGLHASQAVLKKEFHMSVHDFKFRADREETTVNH